MKRYAWLLALAVLGIALLAAPASAAVKEGDKEISVYGSYQTIKVDLPDTPAINVITTQLSGGFFVSNAAQVGGSWIQQSTSNGETFTIRTIGGFFKYHFNTQATTVPYVGAQVGQSTVEALGESESATSYGPLGGIKFFLSENLSINPEASMTFTKILDVNVTITTLQIGMSYYF
jgi:opacity protein-like surface antigen